MWPSAGLCSIASSSSSSKQTLCAPEGVGVGMGGVRDQQTHTPPGLWHTLQGTAPPGRELSTNMCVPDHCTAYKRKLVWLTDYQQSMKNSYFPDDNTHHN
ncbi:hypothetical protein E2C01_022120 [Portunus trituberculatus]|uniref:Uncharacterized protein n=1 Tax=Portunus trituberculatus TaxID=210409 RepID=A0A5B7E6R4_PORTR|nr:hypothetical protein [Portunus trituberculatus]